MSEPTFADHFSGHASAYAAFRPRYPSALFEWLTSVAPGTELAWDVGTGNGQVAHGLVTRFARVVATDPSSAQIDQAAPHPRIKYAVTTYASGLAHASAQLVAVGQALHWFDLDPFFAEARRVLQPRGVVAAGHPLSALFRCAEMLTCWRSSRDWRSAGDLCACAKCSGHWCCARARSRDAH